MRSHSTRVRPEKWVGFATVQVVVALALAACGGSGGGSGSSTASGSATGPQAGLSAASAVGLSGLMGSAAAHLQTDTPVKHLVVIFQENVSFDHYFGTYPNAANLAGESPFTPRRNTPTSINTLKTPLNPSNHFAPIPGLDLTSVTQNPNSLQPANFNVAPGVIINGVAGKAANSPTPVAPFRMSPGQVSTADQDHGYSDEQKAFDNGAMDLFPATVGARDSATSATQPHIAPFNTTSVVLGYFDGNTVTALWNYAQNFAMNDNSYGTTFGPSAPGAINLISGQTNGVVATNAATVGVGSFNFGGGADLANDGNGGVSLISDAQPLGDVCSNRDAAQLGGQNIGDLLNAAHVSWGFFSGGFDLTVVNANGSTGCARTTTSAVTGVKKGD